MRRYGPVTSVLYDLFSGERPVYRRGRLAAIDALRLAPGDRVLVLGAGTGLDLPLIARAVGPTGAIIAVDDSAVMLRRSAARGRDALGRRRSRWPAVRLVLADLQTARTVLPPGEAAVDAVLAVNTLSLIPERRTAWDTGAAAARPGARAAIADIGWRKWEAELLPGGVAEDDDAAGDATLDRVERALLAAGAVPSRSRSKLARALGRDALG